KRVLSIHAHPDDQEFTVAGTLAKWARAGSEIVTVCLTRGEAGSNKGTPADMTRERLAKIREAEQRAACRVLDITEVECLGSADRADTFVDISTTLDLKIRALREHRSQMGDWDPAPMVRGWAREQGARRRLRAAELFLRMVLED